MQRSTQFLRFVTSRAAPIAQTPIRTLASPLCRSTPSTRPSSRTLALSASGQRRWNSSNAPAVGGDSPLAIEPRLSMTMTCTADDCGHRSTHEFTKRSYQKGIVIIQCPSCKNRHLIADHLGWFKESTGEGKLRTIEDLLAARGEKVQRGKKYDDGTIEISGEEEEK